MDIDASYSFGQRGEQMEDVWDETLNLETKSVYPYFPVLSTGISWSSALHLSMLTLLDSTKKATRTDMPMVGFMVYTRAES
jgi:hypothetical protein